MLVVEDGPNAASERRMLCFTPGAGSYATVCMQALSNWTAFKRMDGRFAHIQGNIMFAEQRTSADLIRTVFAKQSSQPTGHQVLIVEAHQASTE